MRCVTGDVATAVLLLGSTQPVATVLRFPLPLLACAATGTAKQRRRIGVPA